MDFYTIFKFLHVVTAIAWVGGGLTLLASNIISIRQKGEMAVLQSLDMMNGLGKLWFIPASFLTVIFGAITATLGGMWGDVWVVLGLAGFAWTFLTGVLFMEPQGRKISAMVQTVDMDGAVTAGRRLLSIAKFDYTVMLVIIADMVLKPLWGDWIVLGAMIVALAAGAAVFLVPALSVAKAPQPAE
jgi:uncharacterized membrane protein